MADSIKSLTKSAMLHQIFNDFINSNSFNKNLSFSQKFFLKSFNSVFNIHILYIQIFTLPKKIFHMVEHKKWNNSDN